MSITARRYSPDLGPLWDEFVAASNAPVLLFWRGFMDYHADRFTDHSVLIYDEGKLVALLPASEHGEEIRSHGGLTFGGLIRRPHATLPQTLECLAAALTYYAEQRKTSVLYKQCPAFYLQPMSFEEEYALFLLEAERTRVDSGFVIELRSPGPMQERRRRSVQKAVKQGVTVAESLDPAPFWNEILTPNLQARFGVKPVHSVEEISLLKSRFPDRIRQFDAWLGGRRVAGTTLFCNARSVHAQYISATDEGRSTGAIDLLFAQLIERELPGIDYFSFGIANEEEGRRVNVGLADWKEGFGARTWTNPFWRISTAHHTRLASVLDAYRR